MKISRNVFIGGIDFNTTPELMEAEKYRMARNVILNALGSDGSLNNMKSTVAYGRIITNWRPSGVNVASNWTCTGLTSNSDETKLYLFLYASTAGTIEAGQYSDQNLLVEFDIATETFDVVLGAVDNNISFQDNILGVNFIKYRGDEYLYWINYDKTPYKVEISEAKAFSVSNLGSYTNEQFDALTSVIQTPPLYPPTVFYTTTKTNSSDNAIKGIFTFKYRYIYNNGGISAFSPVSKVFYNSVLASLGESDDPYYNAINITYNESSENIYAVEIAFMSGSTWYTLPLVRSIGLGNQEYLFTNNNVYTALGAAPTDTKYYDNVPIEANSQEFIKNRIAYANYIDNYASVNDLSLYCSPKYIDSVVPPVLIPTTTLTADWTLGDVNIGETGVHDVARRLTLADIQANASIGDTLSFNLKEVTKYDDGNIDLFFYTWSFNGTIPYTDDLTILDTIKSEIETYSSYSGDSGLYVYVTVNNGTGVLEIRLKSNISEQRFSEGESNFEFVPLYGLASTVTTIENTGASLVTSFKSGAFHEVGVMYYDKYNRQNDVASSSTSTTYVKFFYERLASSYEYIGNTNILWHINSTPPDWASHYQLVYSKNLTTKDFDTYLAQDLTVVAETGNYQLFLSGYDAFREKYTNTPLLYTYQEGDVAFITGYYQTATSDINYETNGLKFNIIGSGISDAGVTYLEVTEATRNKINAYLETEIGQVGGVKFALEIRSNIPNAVDNIYYEIGEAFEIGNPYTVNAYHKGQTRNQNDDLSLLSVTATPVNESSGTARVTAAGGTFTNWMVGDVVTLTANNGSDTQGVLYGQVYQVDETSFTYVMINLFGSEQVSNFSKDIQVIDGATGVLTAGDSFVKERTYVTSWDAGTSIDLIVDSKIPNDFTSTNNTGLGRVQVQKENSRVLDRTASIIISESISEDDNFFGTTSFPNTALDYVDLDNKFSQIDGIYNINDNLYVLQDSRVGIQMVSKDILSAVDGSSQLIASAQVFGNFMPISDGIGTRGNSRYTQMFEGTLFFLDPSNKTIYAVNGQKFEDISSKSIKSILNSDSLSSGVSGIIPQRKEYGILLDDGFYVYNMMMGVWVSANDITPDFMTYAKGNYYSVVNDLLYGHELDATSYNKFYDTWYPSLVTVVANDSKLRNKAYESIAIVGKNIDNVKVQDISTNISIASNIDSMEKEEGIMKSFIGGGYYADSSIASHIMGVGTLQSFVNGTGVQQLTMAEIPHYVVSGDLVYSSIGGVDTYVGYIAGVSGNVITVTVDGTFASADSFITIAKPSTRDGATIRGEYIEFTINFGDKVNEVEKSEYITSVDLEGTYSEPTS